MAEVLVDFETRVAYGGGLYTVRAVGRFGERSHMWEGWLEFLPQDGGDAVVSAMETTQPERDHLVYWATGLTPIFLEGALRRALSPTYVRTHVIEEPLSDAPAERVVHRRVVEPTPDAVLDPFDIGARSLDVLRQELTALNRPRLLNIIAAYDLNPRGEDIAWMSDPQLVTFVITAVDTQLAQRGAGS